MMYWKKSMYVLLNKNFGYKTARKEFL